MNVLLPERRIFGMGMTFTSTLFVIFGIVRFHIITYYQYKTMNGEKSSINFLKWLMLFFMLFADLNMIIFSICPVSQYRNAHNASAGTYFISIFFYFVLNDYLCFKLGRKPKIYSHICTWCILVSLVLHVCLRQLAPKNKLKIFISFSSIFEIIGILLQIVKIYLIINETPKYNLVAYNREDYY